MKLFGLALSAIVFLVSFWGKGERPKTWSIVVSGNTCGHLEPCGCTKPMSGGQKRRATLLTRLTAGGELLVVETGPVRCGASRQDDIKVEALAEFLKLTKTDVLTLGREDATMPAGVLDAARRLSKAAVLDGTDQAKFAKGPFQVVLDRPDLPSADFKLRAAEQEASRAGLALVVVTDGDGERATQVAAAVPVAKLVVYRSGSDPDLVPRKAGATWLVSPGGKGRFVLQMTWTGSTFELYGRHELGPEIPDDPGAAKIFANYNSRVKAEKLLEQMPRFATDKFAGSEGCRSCHQDAHDIWQTSAHSKALATLEKLGQDRDPDCTGCHVVGLTSDSGFRSRSESPQLANVGCESCHGPSAKHVADPAQKTPSNASAACQSCHTLDHSPGFSVEKGWASIKH